MSNNIYNTEIHYVCLQCQLQNGVIAEDVANNNWDEESSSTLGLVYSKKNEQYQIDRNYSYNHNPDVPYPN